MVGFRVIFRTSVYCLPAVVQRSTQPVAPNTCQTLLLNNVNRNLKEVASFSPRWVVPLRMLKQYAHLSVTDEMIRGLHAGCFYPGVSLVDCPLLPLIMEHEPVALCAE